MKTVNVAELKNNLSRYLRHVRAGEEILIRDRKMPVAKIVPVPLAGDFDGELLRLAAEGVVRLPEKKPNLRAFLARKRRKRLQIPLKTVVEAVTLDREEREAGILGH